MALTSLLCLGLLNCIEERPDQVQTSLGYVKGTQLTSRNGINYVAFYGIPYAKSPLGPLRFKDPEERRPWTGVFNATTPPMECIQWNYLFKGNYSTNGTEDCLYLNVYTPNKRKGSLPVMVYTHGGAYETGASIAGHGAEYFMDYPIVIVTISYRIGALGFLSFEDKELPGNMGFKDQIMALRWVKRNVRAFGGDPNRITLMGESSGGASADFHMLSPQSRGLFNATICISGTMLAPWTFVQPGVARQRAMRTAAAANCTANSTREMVECLRRLPARDIVDIRRGFTSELKDPLVFYGPVVDSVSSNPVLPKRPEDLEYADVPRLIGFMSGDGILKTGTYTTVPSFSWQDIDSNFSSYMDGTLWVNYPPGELSSVNPELREFYFDDQPLSNNSYENMTNLFTDGLFFYPTIRTIDRSPGDVYLFYFDYLGASTYALVIGDRIIYNGSCHIDEDIYIWKNIMPNGMFPPLEGDDASFSRSLVLLWTNFIRFGMPTTNESVVNWEKYNTNRRYLNMSNIGFTLESNLLSNRLAFWTSLFST